MLLDRYRSYYHMITVTVNQYHRYCVIETLLTRPSHCTLLASVVCLSSRVVRSTCGTPLYLGLWAKLLLLSPCLPCLARSNPGEAMLGHSKDAHSSTRHHHVILPVITISLEYAPEDSDFTRIATHALLHDLGIELLAQPLHLAHETMLIGLVRLMIPLLIMFCDLSLTIQMESDLTVDSLF